MTALSNAHLLFHLCGTRHNSHAASFTLSSLAFLRHESLALVSSLTVTAVAVIVLGYCSRAIGCGYIVRAILVFTFSFDLFVCLTRGVIDFDIVRVV